MMVSSHYNQTVQRAQKLHNHSQRGCHYRKTQAHLKPYQPQVQKVEDEHLLQNNHMHTFKTLNSKYHKIDNLAQSQPKRDIMPPVKLDL